MQWVRNWAMKAPRQFMETCGEAGAAAGMLSSMAVYAFLFEPSGTFFLIAALAGLVGGFFIGRIVGHDYLSSLS